MEAFDDNGQEWHSVSGISLLECAYEQNSLSIEMERIKRLQLAADGSMDRISELPQAILHHILSFLSQDEAAETSLLSKSWNCVWSTRPNIEFREKWFHGDKEKFMSVLNKTLQGYRDQNLCVHEFLVEMSRVDSEIVLLLEKWIPRVVLNMGVKKFSLYNYSKIAKIF
ncbi:hypothetical protein DH2020_004921 [Rehmannia glutinosa]|uniref:F-box domain-containing protein n=1 Tax=Rehmannia glutinosa TaxID=99300 RepID=A0ABR0XR73_REHGL